METYITSNFLSSSSSISLFSSESVAYFKHELDYGARNGLNIFAPMLWLFEREPLNLISFVSHHDQSEIIIDLRTKFDGLRRRHKPFLRAVHGVLPSEDRENPDH